MKFRIIFIFLVILSSGCIAAEQSIDVIELGVFDDKSISLLYEQVSESRETVRTLRLREVAPDGSETFLDVWEQPQSKSTSIYPLWRDARPYLDSELVAADLKNGTLLTLFRLDSKNYNKGQLFPWPSSDYFQYYNRWNKNDYFLRVFSRNVSGEWEVFISAFLRTFFDDVLNEDVSSVGIENRNKFFVVFERDGSAEEEGLRKRLVFDQTNNLLLVSEANKQVYIHDAYWWSGFDELELNVYKEKSIIQVMKNNNEKASKSGHEIRLLDYQR